MLNVVGKFLPRASSLRNKLYGIGIKGPTAPLSALFEEILSFSTWIGQTLEMSSLELVAALETFRVNSLSDVRPFQSAKIPALLWH